MDEDLAELHRFLNDQADFSLPFPPGFENGPTEESVPQTGHNGSTGSSNALATRTGKSGHSRLVGEEQAIVKVHQEDTSAAHLAAKSWDDMTLPKEVLDGIFEMGFVKPSKIQEWALPIALQGGNIVGQAQNGSGKTAAFALAMILAADASQKWLQGLCVCPTRELASQNYDVISKLGKFTGLELFLAVPQNDRPPRRLDVQIIVGTPGKVYDFVKRPIADARWCKIFVLDEADVMIDESNSMGSQVSQIRKFLPEELQVLFFSATWPEEVDQFAKKMVPRANTIRVQKEDLTLTTIKQTYIDVGNEQWKKEQVLCDLYGALNIGQSIIFVNSR